MTLTAEVQIQGRSLFNAVLQSPNDDTARIVFAEWLEEHTEKIDLANFIRVQVELANWKEPKSRDEDPFYDCRTKIMYPGTLDECLCPRTSDNRLVLCKFHEYKEYERELLKKWKDFVGPTVVNLMPSEAELINDSNDSKWEWNERKRRLRNKFTFDRGLISVFHCFPEVWYAKGPTLVKEHPITQIEIFDIDRERLSYVSQTRTKWAKEIREIAIIQTEGKMTHNKACLFWARREAGLWILCDECKGSGKIKFGTTTLAVQCEKCEGKGWNSNIYK